MIEFESITRAHFYLWLSKFSANDRRHQHISPLGLDVTHPWMENRLRSDNVFIKVYVTACVLINGIRPSCKFHCRRPSTFLAATKQLYGWFSPSVRLSVCPSHLFDYVSIISSSLNFQKLLPVTEVTSMQKVKVRGQRSRSQRSQPNVTVSRL